MGKITSIVSGKGGVGKSTVAFQLGAALAGTGQKVLVMELDNGLQSLDIMAGCSQESVFHLGDVLSHNCKPNEAILKCGFQKNLYVLPGSSVPMSGIKEELANLCKEIATFFSVVILDTPAGLGEQFDAAAAVSDDAIIVCTPDMISVRDAALVSQLLMDQKVEKQRLLINKVDKAKKSKLFYRDFDEIIDTVKVQLIGMVPEDYDLALTSSMGTALPDGNISKKVFEAVAKRYQGGYRPLLIQ